ncbi:hypothetical protein ACWDT6_06115 [Nocardia grenadensis]
MIETVTADEAVPTSIEDPTTDALWLSGPATPSIGTTDEGGREAVAVTPEQSDITFGHTVTGNQSHPATVTEPEVTPEESVLADAVAAVQAGGKIKDAVVTICETMGEPDIAPRQVQDVFRAHGLDPEPRRETISRAIKTWHESRNTTPTQPVENSTTSTDAVAERSGSSEAAADPTRRSFDPNAPSIVELPTTEAGRNQPENRDITEAEDPNEENGHTQNSTITRDGHTPPGRSAREPGPVTSEQDALDSPDSRGHTVENDTDIRPASATAGDHAPVTPAGRTPATGHTFTTVTVTPTTPTDQQSKSKVVTALYYVVALVCISISLNTSWRFFDEVLGISTEWGERWIMFAAVEAAMVACGAGMVHSVRKHGKPGPSQSVTWGLVAATALIAWGMSDDVLEAAGRVIVGPLLGTVMLHLALGLEFRRHGHQSANVVARLARELRERFLSRFGLADDDRDAAQRTRDRAAYRAAALSLPKRARWSRQARLERALLAAGVADDPVMRERMMARLAVVRHAQELANIDQDSPWSPTTTKQVSTAID